MFAFYDPKGDREGNPAKSLVMRNFDATAKACRTRGWISVAEDDVGMVIDFTDAGRNLIVRYGL